MIFKPTAPHKILTQQRGPIGGLHDPRFRYVKADEHTLEGFRARMEQYRAAGIQAVEKAKEGS